MPDPSAHVLEKPMNGGGAAQRLGQWGEELVAEYLRQRGWTVIARNVRCRMGELDIVAENKQYLAFVEVKLRKDSRFGAAREAVTPSKQRKLIAAAQFFLVSHPTKRQPRFDVAEVYAPQGIRTERPNINYIENAF